MSFSLCRCTDKPKDELVDAQGDDGRGDGANHVRHQASVETRHALFLSNESEALQQAGVFGNAVFHRRLAESCSDDLWNNQLAQVQRGLMKDISHTSCGYAIRAAANLADPAAPVVLSQLVISFCAAESLPFGDPSELCKVVFIRS